ncbi:MAG: GNAT family N-acetyltransferase [Desulfobacterales bacterium]|nr:GNAT family N-acetyltransferase [Desulfobacterales bacterium]
MSHQRSRYPKDLVLKDCTEVILRPLGSEDRDDLIQFFNDLPIANRWYLKEDPTQPEVIEKWIRNQSKGKSFCVLAIHENHVVAHASLLRRFQGGRRHLGRIRLMVAQDFRNKRLGTWMIFDLIRRAMELGLEKLRTDFIVGVEDMAIEAARKLDFVKEATLRNYYRDEAGNYYDYQIMVKDLHKEWSDF